MLVGGDLEIVSILFIFCGRKQFTIVNLKLSKEILDSFRTRGNHLLQMVFDEPQYAKYLDNFQCFYFMKTIIAAWQSK